MSLFDDASLVLIPDGAKDGTLYSVKPTDGSGDFTFTRGSNLAATRVDENGLIEKGRENLLLQSNSFDTTWTNSNTTETSGQSGYDGSTDAWKIDKSVASGYITQSISQNSVQTFSVYAKAGTLDWVRLVAVAGTDQDQYFDLSTGTLGATGTNIDAVIDSAGGGWYRCSIALSQSVTSVRIYPADDDNDVSGATGNIYIQDAQLEVGLVATDYIETGATTAQAGILEDMPRLDYSGGTCPALLLEPQRSNLITQSEYLSGLTLSNSPTITQNYAVSPEGVQNAVRIQDTDGANFKGLQTSFSISAGSTYTISIYVKKATSPITTYGGFYFDFDGGTRKISNLIFDEYNGTLVNATGNAITSVIHPVIDEGDYWRFSATATDTGSNTLLRPTLRAGASANGTSLTTVIKDYTAYGFQCELGSYPTSYIPTYGTSVTRGADTCSKTGVSSLIGQTEGTIYWEGIAQPNVNPILVQLIPSAAGNYTNTIYLEYVHSSTIFRAQAWDTGVRQVQINTGNVVAGQVYKLAFAYKANDFALYMNGTQVGTDTSGSVQSGLDMIGVGSLNGTTNAAFYGSEAKQVALFKERLTNAELATLTTP